MTVSHAWLPASPCAAGCLDNDRARVGGLTVARRALSLAAVLASFPVASAVVPRTRRAQLQRAYARAVVRCCGMRLDVIDERTDVVPGTGFAPPGDGVVVVTGHIGWSDVLVLASVQPAGFVARADLVDWPLLGALARRMRVIPIDRNSLKSLPDVVGQIAERVAAGEPIVFFPEGTTWCGRAYGGLRPALFQAAIDTATPVQPVRLRYRNIDGTRSTTPCFVGDDSMVGSLLRLLRSGGITAELVLAPVEEPGTDRRELAARCERAVRGEVHIDFAAHGVLESGEQRNTPRNPELLPALAG